MSEMYSYYDDEQRQYVARYVDDDDTVFTGTGLTLHQAALHLEGVVLVTLIPEISPEGRVVEVLP